MESPRLHSDNPSALPAGTRLGEFELLKLLGVGGFGIVYLAFDHALEREVAVKEYMPASLAGRTETMHVSLRSQSDAETFALGLKSFINEARLLARFDHPSLLKVHRFWEANGTAYMAMPVMRGRTVKELRLEMTGPPDEAWLRALLDPLLSAIEKLHSEGVYHRDIAPDNIQVEPDGNPVLLDFGAARRVISDKSQTLTAILKPAYAPIEQYAEAGAVKQGPWTDIYALGATLHFLLLTRPPPPATTRAVFDEPSLLTPQVLPGCSETFLRTIDWMLAPRPNDRPQSVAQLRDVLDGRAPAPVRREVDTSAQWDRTVVLPATTSGPPTAPPARGAGRDEDATVVVPAPRAPLQPAVTGVPASQPDPRIVTVQPLSPSLAEARGAASPDSGFAAQPLATPPQQAPAKSKLVPMLLGVVLLAAIGAGVAFWPRSPAPVPAAVVEPAASAPVAIAEPPPLPASAVPESTVATVVVPGAPAARPDPAPAATPPAATTRPATGGTTPAVRPTTNNPRPATGAAAVTPAPATTTPAPAITDTPRPQPATTTQAASTPAPAAPVAVPEPPKPAVAGPEARCGGRNPLSYFVCMERECLRSEFSEHADCRKWRQNAKRE